MIKIILIILLLLAGFETAYSLALNHWYLHKTFNLKIKHMQTDPKFQTMLNRPQFAKLANGLIQTLYVFKHVWRITFLVIIIYLCFYNLNHHSFKLLIVDLGIIIYSIYDWFKTAHPIQKHQKIPNYYENQINHDQ